MTEKSQRGWKIDYKVQTKILSKAENNGMNMPTKPLAPYIFTDL